jgi:acyl transferase domain-containing protein/acyl carrier protein
MEPNKLAMLFPGQGACYSGVLQKAAGIYPQVRNIFEEIDAISRSRFGRSVSDLIWQPAAPSMDQMLAEAPDVSQLAIYTVSVSTFQLLASEGVLPDVVMGHSFGEIAALVSSGAFTIRDGAEIVCQRAEAVRAAAGAGYMAALTTDLATAEKLLALAGSPQMAIAAENGRTQTVISGPQESMDRIAEIAKVLKISFFRLNSLYPFHSPLMEPAKEVFRKHLEQFQSKPPMIPVFSPILGRYYHRTDPLPQTLADHLVRSVRFPAAVETLFADGVRVFVEAGALDALTKLVMRSLPEKSISAVATLNRLPDEVEGIRQVIAGLRGQSPQSPAPAILPPNLAVDIAADHLAGFWKEHQSVVEQFIREQYEIFRLRSLNSGPAVPAASAAFRQARASVTPPPASRSAVLRDLVSIYAAALEYPEEVFTENVELEADLGIDSVKQTELLARVSEKYGLPARPGELRLANYSTMGKITDFILSLMPVHSPEAAVEPRVTASVALNSGVFDRHELMREIVHMYAETLEYPEEVFTESVDFEAELGIDSVKQTELLGRLSEKYGLPPRPADFRLANYSTVGKVTDFVQGALSSAAFKG